jgi:hypothetical protein
MKGSVALLLAAVLAVPMIGCRAEGEVGDRDRRVGAGERYERRETTVRPAGDRTVETEVRRDRDRDGARIEGEIRAD